MRTRTWFVRCLVIAVSLLSAASAQAQFGAPQPAVGEVYRVELYGGLWNPTPEITISSAQLGIAGSDIDVVADLGILQKRFPEFRAVLRPARKHKFRIQYVPIGYDSDALLDRSIVFNGIRYDIGIPVTTTARWDTWRFGYEYDFVYRERWFAGLILEAKYTNVEVTLDSPFASEFIRARAPVPAVGGIVRAYPAENWGLTFELTGFKLPEGIDENHRGEYIDIDIYTTLNFTDNVGFQFGYRSVNLIYQVSQDAGDVKLRGFYYGGLVRF
ncbi:MAG: hypothetical protein QF463_14935 [Vicinamibacterales bacterium]|jgi:hypothetical protein|nr:hypothetical protein [Acidobacteriota bacterium]MDP6370990.1 hypothetical protein [Vicinamibacterales bacterium]MDP6610357.1 hypothetical protein [Vicinamibacterales bacterium]HAK55535.1 hypothetical protein [Acidobacteriota bacterium]|tara:strand:- start:760 stop:1572 length:813 start_codon:yes stop_codon:yes gene_type:complete